MIKTRFFATNSLNFLPECDRIIMLKDGEIKEVGTYNQLKNTAGEFNQFIGEFLSNYSENKKEISKILCDSCPIIKLQIIIYFYFFR